MHGSNRNVNIHPPLGYHTPGHLNFFLYKVKFPTYVLFCHSNIPCFGKIGDQMPHPQNRCPRFYSKIKNLNSTFTLQFNSKYKLFNETAETVQILTH